MVAKVVPENVWIKRPHEAHLNNWLAAPRPLYWPIRGSGGMGKSSLLARFFYALKDKKQPCVWMDPDVDVANRQGKGLSLLLHLQTCHTPKFNRARSRLLKQPEALKALDLLVDKDLQAGIEHQLDEDGKGLAQIVYAFANVGKQFSQSRKAAAIEALTREPERELLLALAQDMKRQGVWLLDTWEKVAGVQKVETALYHAHDGSPEPGRGDQSRQVDFQDWLNGIIHMFGRQNVLWVAAGRSVHQDLGNLCLPMMEIGDDTTGMPPFSPDDVIRYLGNMVSNLAVPNGDTLDDLMTATKGNPFLVHRLSMLLRAEKMDDTGWSWDRWPKLRQDLPQDSQHGLAAYALERIMQHSRTTRDLTAHLWRLAVPRHLHAGMAEILFPAALTGVDAKRILRELQNIDLLGKGRRTDELVMHDLDREALSVMTGQVPAADLARLHADLAGFWEGLENNRDWRFFAFLDGAYHQLFSSGDFHDRFPDTTPTEFWKLIEAAPLPPWGVRRFVGDLPNFSPARMPGLIKELRDARDHFNQLDRAAKDLVWRCRLGMTLDDLDWRRIAADHPANPELLDALSRMRGMTQEYVEALYRAAEAADPRHAGNLGNFALFMKNVRGAMDEAERLYRAAEAANPRHAGNLGNFAVFMEEVRGDMDKAERLYRAAEAADSQHVGNLGNFALFMQQVRGDMDEAERLYRAAEAADPRHAGNLGNFALFMQQVRGDMDKAERLYRAAEAADPRHAGNLGNFALFMHCTRRKLPEAEDLYRRTLALIPDDANNLGNLACILIGRGELPEVGDLIDRAMVAGKAHEKPVLLECWFYRYAVFPQWRQQAEGEIESLLAAGIRSPGWDLAAVVARAVELGHPDPDRLHDFAARIGEPIPS